MRRRRRLIYFENLIKKSRMILVHLTIKRYEIMKLLISMDATTVFRQSDDHPRVFLSIRESILSRTLIVHVSTTVDPNNQSLLKEDARFCAVGGYSPSVYGYIASLWVIHKHKHNYILFGGQGGKIHLTLGKAGTYHIKTINPYQGKYGGVHVIFSPKHKSYPIMKGLMLAMEKDHEIMPRPIPESSFCT
jgi:hypothetical protein